VNKLGGLRIPEEMLQDLRCGKEMSIVVDDDIQCDLKDRFRVGSESSAHGCEVEISCVVRGPAVEVFTIVQDGPAQSGAAVLDTLVGLAATGRPPATVVTFLRVKVVMSIV